MKVIQDCHQINGELLPAQPSDVHRWDGEQWILDPEKQAERLQQEGQRLMSAIDNAADAARRLVAGDPLRAVEYERASVEAQNFKDAGYPEAEIPRSVAAWAINGRTARQAADDIIVEADAYLEVLYQLREVRLRAKDQVRALVAEGDITAAQELAEKTIAEIQKLVEGIGNAGGAK